MNLPTLKQAMQGDSPLCRFIVQHEPAAPVDRVQFREDLAALMKYQFDKGWEAHKTFLQEDDDVRKKWSTTADPMKASPLLLREAEKALEELQSMKFDGRIERHHVGGDFFFGASVVEGQAPHFKLEGLGCRGAAQD